MIMDKVHDLIFLEKRQETNTVYTFSFDGKGISWRAGQFMAIIFPEISPHLSLYEHWFTISSAPYQGVVEFTVRVSDSLFKQRLLMLKPGEVVKGHTIDGDFGWPDSQRPVFIAAGIGITPFISMLRQRRYENENLSADLFYYSRAQTPIVFESELTELASTHPEFKICHLTEKPLNPDPILEKLGLPTEAPVFLAGPVPMVDRLGQVFDLMGAKVYRDYYFGYDVRNY